MNEIPEIERQSSEAIKAFQSDRLKELIVYLEKKSPFYRSHFQKHGISSGNIQAPDDLRIVPPVSKDDLQQYNWDFLCVPKSEIAEYTSTSGTMGKPVTIALTQKDLKRLAYNERISFQCAESSHDDLFQLMLTLDRQFMAGIAYYQGIHELEAGLVRVGPGTPLLQWETIQQLRPTAIVAVPSFIVKLIEYAQQHGFDPNLSSVKKAICIGENIRTPDLGLNMLGKKISASWNIQLFGTYASTEMQTAFTECRNGIGGHHHPELIIVEVLDERGNPLPAGQPGEITITTLGIEGMPLLRYQTGDIAAYHEEPCSCGRKTIRIGPVIGRKKQMIKLRGTTLYPPAVFDILHTISSIKDYVVEATTGDLGTDELMLHLLVEEDQKEEIAHSLKHVFQSRLRVTPEIIFASAAGMEDCKKEAEKRQNLLTGENNLPDYFKLYVQVPLILMLSSGSGKA
jgi:phenylacetate-CoA ligase